jgi:phage terminase small subunit
MPGRPPFETTDATPFGVPSPRLKPPATLGPAEKAAFLALVTQAPAQQFALVDLPLIVRWCELTVMAERAMRRLAAEGEVVDGKQNPWFAVHQQATKGLLGLALRLRIGPQCRAQRVPKRTVSQLSYYERLELEKGGHEGDEEEVGATQ